MGRILAIARKDLVSAFRDPAALIAMIATPLAISLIFGFAFPSGSSTSGIDTVVVDQDGGQLGGKLIASVLTSEDVRSVISASVATDADEARRMVDADEATVAVIIPAGLSARMTSGSTTGSPAAVEVYASPTSTVGRAIVEAIVGGVVDRLNAGWAAAGVSIEELVASGLLSASEVAAKGPEIAAAAAQDMQAAPVTLTGSEGKPATPGFDWRTYMGPSMAVMFLMFSVTYSARSILVERDSGTLTRLMVTPTTSAQVMAGKLGGTYAIGLAQMAVLIAALTLLFGMQWGSWPGVILLTLALVFAASGWGALVAAFARTTAQAGQGGSAIALVFAITAGNFVPRQYLPEPIRVAGLVTPNAWGLEGYGQLTGGGGLDTVAVPILACLAMGAVLLAVSTVVFRRRLGT